MDRGEGADSGLAWAECSRIVECRGEMAPGMGFKRGGTWNLIYDSQLMNSDRL